MTLPYLIKSGSVHEVHYGTIINSVQKIAIRKGEAIYSIVCVCGRCPRLDNTQIKLSHENFVETTWGTP